MAKKPQSPVMNAEPQSPAPTLPQAESKVLPSTTASPATETPVKTRVERQNTLPEEDELVMINEAEMEDVKRTFTLELLKSREPVEVVHATPPIAPRIVEQTRLEMEAGKAAVAKAAEQAGNRPVRKPDPSEGKTVAVFSPGDYVPDQKKGQGNVEVRDITRG